MSSVHVDSKVTIPVDTRSDGHNNSRWIFFFYLSILILFRVFGYIGHFGYEDIHYAELAHNLLNGEVDYGDYATFRLPVILLTALFYSLFGISDLTSALPAMLASASILLILFQVLRKEGSAVLFIGLGLTTLSSWFLFYTDKLMPDIHVALSVIAMIAVLNQYKYRSSQKRPILYAFLLALSVLYGFMSSGTIVLVLPLLVFLFLFDIITGRDRKFWLYFFLTGLAVFSLYFLIIRWVTGDFLERFDAIAGNRYLNICNYAEQPIRVLFVRISIDFFKLLLESSMALGFVLVLALFFGKVRPGYFSMKDSFSFFMVSSLILLLSANFMTISISSYSPMCLEEKDYLYLLPVVSVPASQILVRFSRERRFLIPVLAGIVLLVLLSFEIDRRDTWQLYFPLAIFCVGFLLVPSKRVKQSSFPYLFVAVLLVQPLIMTITGKKVGYWQQKKAFREVIMEQNPDCLVITNEVQKRLGYYYLQFDHNTGIELVNYQEFRYDSTDQRKKILLLNGYTRYLSFMEDKDLPYYARHISPANTLIHENKVLNLAIYDMTDLTLPKPTGKLLLHSTNEFPLHE